MKVNYEVYIYSVIDGKEITTKFLANKVQFNALGVWAIGSYVNKQEIVKIFFPSIRIKYIIDKLGAINLNE